MSRHIAVLMGGFSSERPVSLNSGEACAAALEEAGYQVTRVDVERNLAARLAELKPDVAFNALHGPFGEDGTVQGVLEFMGIPYTHSGVLASALAMDKERSKVLARNAGIPIAESKVMNRFEIGSAHPMPTPYVIKPVTEGSSFGVLIVDGNQPHPPQSVSSDSWKYGDMVMVERYIHGRELTCAVMGDVAIGVTEIIPNSDKFYDYDEKYTAGGARHVCPADLPPHVKSQIQDYSLRAHKIMGCRGISRSDFRYDDRHSEDGEIIWLEINTQPGMTEQSLAPELAAYAGHSMAELVSWLVEDASCGR
ncbi:D-alanine--D-alanine ligase [Notoacmeibacter ruber]|uniref:D-alanine--D-alanine ligase n=1 Tax=Notoacmeibacter ruber TaxID=2670375 RepID=A0A3L7JCH4_9HYPH|nr:D-alanine--D-alanine ligase [Notoacmeibacter ruber]RLQ88180.1 D-alanine--D-alanine ligase [Notoacmeibacter ruber]